MLRKIVAALAATATLFFIAPTAPAQAKTDTRCHEYSRGILSSGFVCAEVVHFTQADGTGEKVTQVTLFIQNQGAFESDPAVVCYQLRIQAAGGVNQWGKDGTACDVNNGSGVRQYTFGDTVLKIPSGCGKFFWNYKARLDDGASDVSDTLEFDFC